MKTGDWRKVSFILNFTCVAVLLICGNAGLANERPNIVLVMCDDLGWGDVGFNGGKVIQTPHLDEMAKASLRFTRFYAQSPVCSPTRGSCLTGRHPYRYGIYFANTGHMKEKEHTLAEVLKDHGYTTGHFGKWHLGTLTRDVVDANRGGRPKNASHFSTPQMNGFDVCFSTESKVPTYDPMLKPKKAGNAWNSLEDRSQGEPYGTYYWNEKGDQVTENLLGDNSRVIMDRAVPFMEDAVSKAQPFFAIVWFHTPHLPVVAGPEYRELYPDAKNTRAQNYFGCVTAMDEQMGRLRSTLKRLGVQNNTIVTFCSDNGPEGNDKDPGSAGHFRGRKRSLYEGGIRVPGLIEWPEKIPTGRTTDFPAVTSDYLPTLMDILDVEPLDTRPIDGISLMPLLDNEMETRPNAIGFQSKEQLALSDNRFKLYRKDNKAKWELYDLLEDPTESENVLQRFPNIAKQMISKATAWQESCSRSDRGEDYPQN